MKKTAVVKRAWNVVSGWPPKKARATASARPAAGSGAGRRTRSSLSRSSHGISGKMLVSGHASQTTKKVPKAKTTPLGSAPPKRMPSARASRNAPKAATKSFNAAASARDFQNGSTNDGQLKGEKTAFCVSARKGRPRRCGGSRGDASGTRRRAYCANGWNTTTESASSKFAPSPWTSAGRSAFQGTSL